MKTKNSGTMTFEKLLSRSFSRGSSRFWSDGPRGLELNEVHAYLDSGGDVNRRSESGDMLLQIAAYNGEAEIVQLLLAHSADINAQGHHGYTALHLAVDADIDGPIQSGRMITDLPVARLLIEAGADESVRTDDGKAARDIAVAYGKKLVALYDSIPRTQSGRS